MNYEDLGIINKGGFGIVHKVLGEDGNEYALKKVVIPSTSTEQEKQHLLARFGREIKYQQSIVHPNIVKIFESNLNADNPFYVMELAVGTLKDELDKDKNLSSNLWEILFDILNGLEEIQLKGFAHRDLKPHNILKIKNNDGSYRYAISDFGLMSPGDLASTTLTGTGVGGGTPMYAAPELARNFASATFLADIYSFGAILHDIFDGNPRIPYQPLTVKGDLKEIVEKCTKANPVRRFSSIAEIRIELEKVSSKYIVNENDEDNTILKLLESSDVLSEEDWDRIYYYAESKIDGANVRLGGLFRAFSEFQIKYLVNNEPNLAVFFAKNFAIYIRNNSFDFAYCDVLSSKAALFYEFHNYETKIHILFALLQMGVSHNRWAVENRFVNLINKADNALLQRFINEVDATNFQLKIFLERLSSSIGYDLSKLPDEIKKRII